MGRTGPFRPTARLRELTRENQTTNKNAAGCLDTSGGAALRVKPLVAPLIQPIHTAEKQESPAQDRRKDEADQQQSRPVEGSDGVFDAEGHIVDPARTIHADLPTKPQVPMPEATPPAGSFIWR